jgi:hypothetical protein
MNTCPEIKKIIIFTQCRKITLILAILLPLFICAQNFQMTIKPGTLANAVKATARPGLPIDGRFSSAQICFIVSTSVGARPVISIVQNFISVMNYSIFESIEHYRTKLNMLGYLMASDLISLLMQKAGWISVSNEKAVQEAMNFKSHFHI